MKKTRKLALTLVAAFALMASAGAASAFATTVRSGSTTGSQYTGSVSGSLISSSVAFQSGFVNVSCNQSSLAGSLSSTNVATVSSATWTNNGSSACPNNLGGTSVSTAQNLPWSSGSVAFSKSGTTGPNGTLTLAPVEVKVVTGGSTTCWYKGSGSGGSVTGDLYNPNDTNKPVGSNSHAQVVFSNEGLTLDKTQSNGFLCSSSATFSATYQITGSGGVDLYVTQ